MNVTKLRIKRNLEAPTQKKTNFFQLFYCNKSFLNSSAGGERVLSSEYTR